MAYYPLDFAALIKDRDYEGIKALVISKVPLIIAALVILVVGFIISNLIAKLTVKAMKLKKVDESIYPFIKTIVSIFFKIIFILTALSTIGVNINSFIAAIAAGGITAGLGLQQSFNQFFSGIEILVNHPFKSGDYIDIGSVAGIVKEIKIMKTKLITLDNRLVIVPNSTISTSNIIKYNAQGIRRIDLKYTIPYSEDIEKAREALLYVATGFDMILKKPEPSVSVMEHGQSSIVLACFVWCDSKDYWPVYFYMQENTKKEFDKRGIVIPFNQLDVHIVDSGEKQ